MSEDLATHYEWGNNELMVYLQTEPVVSGKPAPPIETPGCRGHGFSVVEASFKILPLGALLVGPSIPYPSTWDVGKAES